jgi:hypothetical protein
MGAELGAGDSLRRTAVGAVGEKPQASGDESAKATTILKSRPALPLPPKLSPIPSSGPG